MTARMQRCWYCSDDLGVFDHSDRDGPLSCGDAQCKKQACADERDMAREQDEQARHEAEQDGFARYGGGGR